MWDPNGHDENARHDGRDAEPGSADPYADNGAWEQGPGATSADGTDPYGTGPGVADLYGAGPGAGGIYGSQPGVSDPYGTASGSSDPYGGGTWSASGSPAASFASPDPAGAGQGPVGAPYGPVGPSYGPMGPPYGPAGPAQYHGVYAMPAPTSAMALTGFIVGLASLILCSGLPAPVGLVFSILGMRETSPSAETVKSGRGFAIAGLVISILGTLLLAFVVAYFVIVFGALFFVDMQ
ncbi:DUF4190 domain-containing protein [Brachybacterium sacelli]